MAGNITGKVMFVLVGMLSRVPMGSQLLHIDHKQVSIWNNGRVGGLAGYYMLNNLVPLAVPFRCKLHLISLRSGLETEVKYSQQTGTTGLIFDAFDCKKLTLLSGDWTEALQRRLLSRRLSPFPLCATCSQPLLPRWSNMLLPTDGLMLAITRQFQDNSLSCWGDSQPNASSQQFSGLLRLLQQDRELSR